ncbi:hypothetical protein ACX0G9_27615 [Flavitalea flava]
MKNIRLLMVLLCLFGPFACKKSGVRSTDLLLPPLIRQAQQYFMDSVVREKMPVPGANTRQAAEKTEIWEEAAIIDWQKGKAVLVPVKYGQDLVVKTEWGGDNFFHLNNLAHLLIYWDAEKTGHAELVTTFPDKAFLGSDQRNFSGVTFVEDWSGNLLSRDLVNPDGSVWKYKPVQAKVAPAAVIRWCTTIYGYNTSGSNDDPVFWSESGGCYYQYLPDTDYGGPGVSAGYGGLGASGGNGGGSGGRATVIIPPPSNIIASAKEYFKCFTNNASALYQVKVCVDQPNPGVRTAWRYTYGEDPSAGIKAMVDVGHTFLVFTETIGSTTITRNIGFYPVKNVTPRTSSSQGVLNNDESHHFDISGTFSVSQALFLNMLNFVVQGNSLGYLYDINSNNCTTFAINTLAAGHIYLPSTIGSWIGGMGNDPGDLGEDIRAHNFIGMTRSTTEVLHQNSGTCN